MNEQQANKDSLILFRFRLSPPQACMNLNFQGLSVPPASIVCTRDVLGVQLVLPPDKIFDDTLLAVKRLAASLLDVHAYCAFPQLPPLDLMAESWFEIKEAGPRNTVFGYADSSLEFVPLVPGHPDNVPFTEAAELVPMIDLEPPLGAAFADFRVARRQTGSYTAFFAFRALEDVAYTFGSNVDGKPDWAAMNSALRSVEEHWEPLTRAAEAARHNPARSIAPSERDALLGRAKEALDRKLALMRRSTGTPEQRASC